MFNSKGNRSSSFLKSKSGSFVFGLTPKEGFSSFSLDALLPLVSFVSWSTSIALLKISSLRSSGGTGCNLTSNVFASSLLVIMGS